MNLRPHGGSDRGRVREDLGGRLGDHGEGGEGDEGDGLHCDMYVYERVGRMRDERWMVKRRKEKRRKGRKRGREGVLLFNLRACRL